MRTKKPGKKKLRRRRAPERIVMLGYMPRDPVQALLAGAAFEFGQRIAKRLFEGPKEPPAEPPAEPPKDPKELN